MAMITIRVTSEEKEWLEYMAEFYSSICQLMVAKCKPADALLSREIL